MVSSLCTGTSSSASIKSVRIRFFILTLLSLLVGVKPVVAVTVTISNAPATISDQPFSLDISVSGASPATNYLRANLFPPGTTNYFGYTYNGTDYINSSNYSQYFPITIDSSGNWNGSIQAKIDTTSTYYTGPGTYNLKVRRYTQSGSSYTWSNELSVLANLPTPTPTPTPTPSSTPSPTPTKTPSPAPTSTSKKSASQTNTPSPVSTPTLISSPKNTSLSNQSKEINSPQPKISSQISYHIASVAAATASATTEGKVEVKNQKQTNPFLWIGLIFIFAGTGAVGYIYLKKNAKIRIKF